MSYAEDLFEESLKIVLAKDEQIIKNCRPEWLLNKQTNYRLEYDFYIPRLKIAFEIQGQHHYDDTYQKYKDQLKQKLSVENGIALFAFSIFQLRPSNIRRKLITYSYKVGERFDLQNFNLKANNIILEKIRNYQILIKNSYGKTECQISPNTLKVLQQKKEVIDFISKNKCFNIKINNQNIRCRFVDRTEKKILIETSYHNKRYISYSKLFEMIGLSIKE